MEQSLRILFLLVCGADIMSDSVINFYSKLDNIHNIPKPGRMTTFIIIQWYCV
jgi:hypothetical protein